MSIAANNTSQVREILMAEAHDIGHGQSRNRLEDRARFEKMKTAGGLELYVGMVADGVGGASAGETASQTAVDTVFERIQAATGSDISLILEDAVVKAHQVVREMATTNASLRTMSTTATVAAVCEGKLYLAHVGDSRAYLVRGEQIRLLTLDHTWANEMVRMNRFSPQEVANHPKREELARYIGQPVPFEVDGGVRLLENLEPGVHPSKSSLSREGLPLQPGDVVVLCTDGLIKERHKATGHYVEAAEITREVQRKRGHPQDSANTLVSLALGRRTDDNVSVVILEAPGGRGGLGVPPLPGIAGLPKMGGMPKLSTRLLLLSGGVILALVVVIALAGMFLKGVAAPTPITTSTQTPTVQAALPTPAVWAVVESTSGPMAQVSGSEQNSTTADKGNQIVPGQAVLIQTGNGSMLKLRLTDGSVVYVNQNTRLFLSGIAGTGSASPDNLLTLEEGTVLVVSKHLIVKTRREFTGAVSGGVMGVTYDTGQTRFVVDCLAGTCSFGQASLQGGAQAGTNAGVPISGPAFFPIWQDLQAALGGNDVPLPTDIPTPTATLEPTVTGTATPTKAVKVIQPTITPSKKPGGGGGGGGGDEPIKTEDPGSG